MSIETVSMAWIKSMTKGPFFAPDTMRYFRSRLPEKGGLRSGDSVWFWTSEANPHIPDDRRAWTLRHLDLVTGSVRTVGDFQQYATAAEAWTAVREAAHNNLPQEAA